MFLVKIYYKSRNIFVQLFEQDFDTPDGLGDYYFYPVDLLVKVTHFT
jgi:hypothetical protein